MHYILWNRLHPDFVQRVWYVRAQASTKKNDYITVVCQLTQEYHLIVEWHLTVECYFTVECHLAVECYHAVECHLSMECHLTGECPLTGIEWVMPRRVPVVVTSHTQDAIRF